VAEATAKSRITTGGFIGVSLAPDIFTTNDIQVAAASGAICVRSKGVPSLLGYEVTITLCDFNESILEMLLASSVLSDYTTPVEQVGGVISSDGTYHPNTVVVEWWSENAKNDACATGGANPKRPYLHYVLPRVNRWVPDGNLDFGNSETTMQLKGYAQPTKAFAKVRAVDTWTAADLTSLNASGLLGWREVQQAALPATNANGYDL